MRSETLSAARALRPHAGSRPSDEPIGLWRASRRAFWCAALTLVFAFGFSTLVAASVPPDITRVEEDWELIVDVPEPDSVAPQITTSISPDPDYEDAYGVFEFNHATQPEYSPGGLQVQAWNGEHLEGTKRQLANSLLSVASEPIAWTASMSVEDYWIRFQISAGSSQSWGAFGSGTTLRKGTWTWRSNLNGYSPEVSVDNSRVGFASNRVKKLTLKRVRYYSGSTLVSTDQTERVVFEPNDLVESSE